MHVLCVRTWQDILAIWIDAVPKDAAPEQPDAKQPAPATFPALRETRMHEPVSISPDAVYDDGALYLLLGLTPTALTKARRGRRTAVYPPRQADSAPRSVGLRLAAGDSDHERGAAAPRR